MNTVFKITLFVIISTLFGCAKSNLTSPQAQFENQLSKAEQGNPTAQYVVGSMYKRGSGIQQDLKKSCEWFEKSAVQNDADAKAELYECYLTGGGFGANPEEARKWLLAGAKDKQKPSKSLEKIRANFGEDYKGIDLVDITYFVNAGIVTKTDLDKAIFQMKSDSLYSKNYNLYNSKGVFLWVQAINYSNVNGVTLNQALEVINKKEISKVADQQKRAESFKREQDEKEKAQIAAMKRLVKAAEERAANYPYEAILSCGFNGQHISAIACFTGKHTQTQLELRNGDEYGMYQNWELQRAGGQEYRDGLHISLNKNFSITAQNASDDLILNLKIVDKKTNRVLYEKSAAKYGVVSARN